MASRRIYDRECPCCGAQLNGTFQGESTLYRQGAAVFESFYLQCPSKSRGICLHTSPEFKTDMLWTVDAENRMDSFKKSTTPLFPSTRPAILYAYAPNFSGDDEFWKGLPGVINKLPGNMCRGLAVPDYLYERVKPVRHLFYILWILNDGMFEQCRPTAYGSRLAEANILNERRRWLDCQLLAIYPTISREFKLLGDIDIDYVKPKLYSNV